MKFVVGGFTLTTLFGTGITVIFCYKKFGHFDESKVYHGFGHACVYFDLINLFFTSVTKELKH